MDGSAAGSLIHSDKLTTQFKPTLHCLRCSMKTVRNTDILTNTAEYVKKN